jgi:uncharacterized protein involved in exopolysaccharide biosynthesis
MAVNTRPDEGAVHQIGLVKPPVEQPPAVLQIPLAIAFRVIRRAGKVVLAAALVGGVLGFVVASMNPPLYDSIATLVVTRLPTDTRAAPVPAFRALLETNALTRAAINEFHLDMTPSYFRSVTLVLEEVRNTNLIRVHARLPNPETAAKLADFVARRGIALSEGITDQQTTDFRAQLKGMLGEATTRMKDAEQQLLKFRGSAQIDATRKDADAALNQRGQLLALTVDIEAEKARNARAKKEIQGQQPYLQAPRRVDAEAALRGVDPRPPDTFRAAPTETGGADKDKTKDKSKDKPITLDWEKPGADLDPASGLDLTNAFANPVYQVLQYQISLSETRLAALEARKRQLVVGGQRVDGPELTPLGSLYSKEIQEQRLQTEFDLTKAVYTEVSLAHERARLQSAGMTARLQLIDEAVPPDVPMSRHRVLYALLFAAAGGGLALIALASFDILRAR